MDYYKSLGDLLRGYRSYFKLTQQELCDKANIDIKTLQRWEGNLHPPKVDNLRNLSDSRGIPMSALNHLNAGSPIHYDIRKRRFAFSKYDTLEYINKNYLDLNVPLDEGLTESYLPISSEDWAGKVLKYDHAIYPTNNPLKIETLLRAAAILPALNIIAIDAWKLHVGHLTCLPISMDIYASIRNQLISESQIGATSLSDIIQAKAGVLYFYSVYGASTQTAHNILSKAKGFLRQHCNSGNFLLAGYSVTKDGIELCTKLKMKMIFENTDEFNSLRTEVKPGLYEGHLQLS
ncbi:MAG: helix-turn-helix transcriptional regulator [Nitrospirae bacterium]|nr:helix-turn-helix transcriptional regulator [Nitrospirota bacterium]